jgi:hypothetical protein
MCRYAGKNYKRHFVCFACRKQFKRPQLTEVLEQQGTLDTYLLLLQSQKRATARAELESIEADYRALIGKCPQCGAAMADLGMDFKPPRSSAIRTWQRLQGMYRLGRTWQTCGCDGPGYIPIDQTDYAAYLRSCLKLYTKRLKEVERGVAEPAERKQQGQYWSGRIQKIQAVLATR